MKMKGGMEYGLPAYMVTSFVGYSKVEAKQHHWRDVAVGAATGVLTTNFFTQANSLLKLGMNWNNKTLGFKYQRSFN